MNLRKRTRFIRSVTCSYLTRADQGFNVFLRRTGELYLSISSVSERYPVFKFTNAFDFLTRVRDVFYK